MNCMVADAQLAPAGRAFCLEALVALGLAAAIVAPAVARPVIAPLAEPTSTAPQANPALWEVHDGDTLIYLFGTFHTLDERTIWFDRSVRDAFDRSGELVLETIVPSDPARLREIGRAVIGPRPAPGGFLAATRAASGRSRAVGLSVDHGADAVLRRAAADQGMSLSGIEPFSEQLRTFTQISAVSPAPAPSVSAPPIPAPPFAAPQGAAPVTVGSLLTAWKTGDTQTFGAMLAGFEAKSPAAYRLLISERNALYGEWIAERLAQPGTVFVAVGSGHLAGKDSIQNWLSTKGIQARRIG